MSTQQYQKFQRGSEWRKWDLHIHTPKTLCSEYGGDTDVVWKKYFQELEELSDEIKVLGINDYLFLDGYKEVLKYKQSGGLKKIDLILPVIEFRLKEFVGSDELRRLNYHIIFADDELLKAEQIETHFLAGLRGKVNLSEDVPGGYTWGGVVSPESLFDLGKAIFEDTPVDKRESNPNYLDIGFNNINFEYTKIEELLGESGEPNTYLKGKYFKAIGKSEWEAFRWDGSPAEKKTIINSSHFVFSASPTSDIANGGKDSLKAQGVNSRLLHCSDAHCFAEDKNKTKPRDLGHCFTWIKADPTFEGLKQIIYEFDERVRIQELKPDERESYQIIDSVKFIDDKFTPDEILISQNLTAIIGGKSTGKSILLRNIAKAIDATEVQKRLEEVALDEYKKDANDFIVTWSDGHINRRAESNESRKIIYIPQSYLNRLVDKKEDTNSIDDIIRNVLEQNSNVLRSFEESKNFERRNEVEIVQSVDDSFYTITDIIKQREKIKIIGDKKGIESEIRKLDIEIKELENKSGMKPEEINNYNELAKEISRIKNEIDVLEKNAEGLKWIMNIDVLRLPDLSGISKDMRDKLDEKFILLKSIFESNWKKDVGLLVEDIDARLVSFKKEKQLCFEKIAPLLEKVKESKSLNEKNKRKQNEEVSLKTIIDEEEKLENLNDKYREFAKKARGCHFKFYDNLFETKTSILKHSVIGGEIAFDIDIIFKENNFREFIAEVFNMQKIGRFIDVNLAEYKYADIKTLKDDVKKIFEGILGDKIVLKGGYTKKDAILKLLQNWFIFNYKIQQSGDDISQMSPGKKSFVLLKLLIELDKSKCPILLDQPEDDLDNRSIYNDLVGFIKNKKKERQIIIATHNPNLVVGADSENIIVANQNGEKTPNEKYSFEYVSGSLEKTFIDGQEEKTLYKQGIQEHVCEILEGGKEAFEGRRKRYNF